MDDSKSTRPGDLSKDPSPQVALYFEILLRLRSIVDLQTKSGVESEGELESVDAVKGRMTVLVPKPPPSGLGANEMARIYFNLFNQRWSGQAMVQYFQDSKTKYILNLPKKLELSDRRKQGRAPLDSSKNVQGTVRAGAYEGLIVLGRVVDLSQGGFCMQVTRALDPQTRDKVDFGQAHFREGLDLESVKIVGLGESTLECAGRVSHVTPGRDGVMVGVRFKNLRPVDRTFLDTFLPSHLAPIPAELPVIDPKSIEPLVTTLLAKAPPAHPVQATVERKDKLLRLKKRLRSILLCMPPSTNRDALMEYLLEDGYGAVLPVGNLVELSDAFRARPIHLVLIDGGIQEMQGVELASFVYFARGDQPCPIFLAENQITPELTILAGQAGVTQLLQRPYLNDEFLQRLEHAAVEGLPKVSFPPQGSPELPDSEIPERYSPVSPGRSGLIKRIKAVALAMPPGAHRDTVKSFLEAQGFTRVVAAGTLAELVRVLETPALALCVLDWEDREISELEILPLLHGRLLDSKVPILVVLADASPHHVKQAKFLGAVRVLEGPLVCNQELVDDMLQILLETE